MNQRQLLWVVLSHPDHMPSVIHEKYVSIFKSKTLPRNYDIDPDWLAGFHPTTIRAILELQALSSHFSDSRWIKEFLIKGYRWIHDFLKKNTSPILSSGELEACLFDRDPIFSDGYQWFIG